MAAFTAVDLSKLQAPDLIDQFDFESIFASALAQFVALMPEFSAMTESNPVYKLLQLFAAREMNLRQQVNEKAKQCMLAFATGNNLDHLGALFGMTRLTDAHADAIGIRATRRKGSRDNVTSWNDELRATWSWLTEYRAAVTIANGVPVPIKPSQRKLLVNQWGLPLLKSGLDSAWQRMIHMAIEEKVIAPEQRFSLHGLKHRGITDTEGNRADKQEAAGHATPQMTNRYDHAVPIVQPPKRSG